MEISPDYLNKFTVNEKQNDSYELRKQISLLVERPIGQIMKLTKGWSEEQLIKSLNCKSAMLWWVYRKQYERRN